MPEPLLIEHLDVIKQLHLGVAVAGELVNKLTLDGRKEAFHHGVVGAVAAATHATNDAARTAAGRSVTWASSMLSSSR